MKVHISEVNGSNSLDRAKLLLEGVPRGTYKALYFALKRAGDMGKTAAGRFAAEEYTIRKGDFMRNVRHESKVKMGSGSVSLEVSFAGNVLPLLTFNTRYSRGGKVQTRVKRESGATVLGRAFVANAGRGLGVYERVGDERYPIEQKYGPSTGHMMQNEQVIEKMDKTISENFEQRLEHEIYRILNGFGMK